MAYQTLPNTFVSGGTIYSTAVSANMVALLQGYTTGSYDLWGNDVDAKTLDINSGTAGILSGGTANFGTTTVTTLTVSSDVAVGNDCTVAGDLTVTGDVATSTLTAWTPAFLNSVITASTAASGVYWQVGKTVFYRGTLSGTSTGDSYEIVSLPVTAGTMIAFMDEPVSVQSAVCLTVGVLRIVSNQKYATLLNSDTSFVSGVAYRISYGGSYRSEA